MIKLDHLALVVADYRASRDRYTTNLGLMIEFEIPERATAALQDDAEFTFFVHQAASDKPAGSSTTLYFQVEDVVATHRDLVERDVAFVHGPRKEFWGFGAELLDPDGHVVRLWDERSMREEGGG
jgi:catechol 2,3-dioxygenase-like lactoylglutathione lyase family enzyme